MQQVVGGDQPRLEGLFQWCGIGRQQLEPVVVRGQGEGDRADLRQPVGEERGHPFVNESPLDGIEEQMVALTGAHALDQQLVGRRQA
jgi:hypothetical protein